MQNCHPMACQIIRCGSEGVVLPPVRVGGWVDEEAVTKPSRVRRRPGCPTVLEHGPIFGDSQLEPPSLPEIQEERKEPIDRNRSLSDVVHRQGQARRITSRDRPCQGDHVIARRVGDAILSHAVGGTGSNRQPALAAREAEGHLGKHAGSQRRTAEE